MSTRACSAEQIWMSRGPRRSRSANARPPALVPLPVITESIKFGDLGGPIHPLNQADGHVENAISHSMYVQRPEDTSGRFKSKEETVMRVLVLAKEGEANGAATPPSPEALAEYQKFNDELVKAGVVLESGRLSPSSRGKRVRFEGKNRTVIDGPFAESKELVGGYWLWQVRSIDEALEWLKRAPYDGGTFEIREVAQHEGA